MFKRRLGAVSAAFKESQFIVLYPAAAQRSREYNCLSVVCYNFGVFFSPPARAKNNPRDPGRHLPHTSKKGSPPALEEVFRIHPTTAVRVVFSMAFAAWG